MTANAQSICSRARVCLQKRKGRRQIHVIVPPFSSPPAERQIEEKTNRKKQKQQKKKKMEFFWELSVTAVLSFIFAVLLSKLVASASTDSPSSVASAVDLPPQSVLQDKDSARVDEGPKGVGDAVVAAGTEVEWNSDGGDGVLASGVVVGGAGVGMETDEASELELKRKVAVEGAVEESIEEKETTFEDRIDRGVSVESGCNDAVCENVVEKKEKEEGEKEKEEGEKEEGEKEKEKEEEEEEKEENFIFDEEEWEGIERSELEKHFDAVVRSVDSGSAEVLAKIGGDVLMQLYGLHKVATEGPCYEPQPSVLKARARAKWY